MLTLQESDGAREAGLHGDGDAPTTLCGTAGAERLRVVRTADASSAASESATGPTASTNTATAIATAAPVTVTVTSRPTLCGEPALQRHEEAQQLLQIACIDQYRPAVQLPVCSRRLESRQVHCYWLGVLHKQSICCCLCLLELVSDGLLAITQAKTVSELCGK